MNNFDLARQILMFILLGYVAASALQIDQQIDQVQRDVHMIRTYLEEAQ